MPIISRSLESVQQSTGGTVLVSFLAIDGNGREWRRSRARFADEASALAASNAFNWDEQLRDREKDDTLKFIRKGGNPKDFVKIDLTDMEFNKHLVGRFAKAAFLDDREFMCNIASWIIKFTAIQIENILGISLVKAQKVLDRATHIRDTVCVALVIDDSRIQVDD